MSKGLPPVYTFGWPAGTPGSFSNDFSTGVVVGMRMQAAVAGAVVGVRFFRELGDEGEHVGLLLAAGNLAILDVTKFHQVAASGVGADKWHSAYFRRFHRIGATGRFVVAVLFQNGGYYSEPAALATGPMVNGNLRFTGDGDGGSNGLFSYGGVLPTSTFNSNAYGVDCIYREDQ